MMLPTIQEHDGLQQAVNAKDLYQSLGLNATNWSRWHVTNIADNPFALAGVDYHAFVMMTNGNETQNYALSIDFAKKLAMQARTDKGEQVRDYFIECEERLKQPVMPETALPKNYLSALKTLVTTLEEKQVIQDQLVIAQVKSDALDTITQSIDTFGVRDAAKNLDMKQGDFVEWCTDEHKPLHLRKPISSLFMYRDGKGRLNAYSHRIEQGFMEQKINAYIDNRGQQRTSKEAIFTAAGVAHIAKLIKKEKYKMLEIVLARQA